MAYAVVREDPLDRHSKRLEMKKSSLEEGHCGVLLFVGQNFRRRLPGAGVYADMGCFPPDAPATNAVVSVETMQMPHDVMHAK